MACRGFVPASQLRVKGTTPEELIGMEIPMKILETDTKRNKLILSQRLAVQEEKAAQREKILTTLEAGQVVKGEVVRIADFGCLHRPGRARRFVANFRNFLGAGFTPIRCFEGRARYHNQSAQSGPRKRSYQLEL